MLASMIDSLRGTAVTGGPVDKLDAHPPWIHHQYSAGLATRARKKSNRSYLLRATRIGSTAEGRAHVVLVARVFFWVLAHFGTSPHLSPELCCGKVGLWSPSVLAERSAGPATDTGRPIERQGANEVIANC